MEEGDFYEIEASYPETQNKAVNEIFKHFIREQSEQFKEDTGINRMAYEEARELGLGPDRKYRMVTTYQNLTSTRAYNYFFTVSLDTGGAHPNQFSTTFSFDKTGAALTLPRLFNSGSDYLGVISDYVRRDLKGRD